MSFSRPRSGLDLKCDHVQCNLPWATRQHRLAMGCLCVTCRLMNCYGIALNAGDLSGALGF